MIEGGHPLSGRVRASGNKNGALPILAACLLTEEPVTLDERAAHPRRRHDARAARAPRRRGRSGPGRTRCACTRRTITHEVDEELASRIRASFLLAGPLLARLGRASVPPPGGDVIGRRRLDPHIHAFAELGAAFEYRRSLRAERPRLRGAHIHLDEASVMATENAVMAASLAPGKTMISNAACEPHVQDLCRFLVSLGAKIDGIGSNVLHVTGVERLFGGAYSIGPEHIEVGSFIGMAAVTGGDITIEGIVPDDLWPVLPVLRRLGVEVELGDDWVRVPPDQELVDRRRPRRRDPEGRGRPVAGVPRRPHVDRGRSSRRRRRARCSIFEKMFESRLFFVDKLVSMGARIILCDPHRVVVTGPAQLYGQRMSSPDIRAGMAMVIAALCAEGTSTIGDAYQIDKGYERIDERLRALGARIERVEG